MIRKPRLVNMVPALAELRNHHCRKDEIYLFLESIIKYNISELFSDEESNVEFGPFGILNFPYRSMGNITTHELFGMDELIIFSFYWINKSKYKKVADVGANLGLHSIILDRCEYEVRAFEPDPNHLQIMNENFKLNHIKNVEIMPFAVSDVEKEVDFVRVLGNTTSSHIEGSKTPYGNLETFKVKTIPVKQVFAWADLVKLDIEGHEAVAFCATDCQDWEDTDMIFEIGSDKNREKIFDHANSHGINLFSQKKNWQKVNDINQLPTHHSHGSAFASKNSVMNWEV